MTVDYPTSSDAIVKPPCVNCKKCNKPIPTAVPSPITALVPIQPVELSTVPEPVPVSEPETTPEIPNPAYCGLSETQVDAIKQRLCELCAEIAINDEMVV